MARLRRDETAVFPVFEAVLVAVLILTTILFFTSLQRPTTATDAGGLDLGRLASDTLKILQTKEFAVAAACGPDSPLALEEWVNATMKGQSCVATEVEEFLSEVLPPGTQFQVRLDNGVEPLVLVPYGSTSTPRAGRAAETYINPVWRPAGAVTPAGSGYPGQQIDTGTMLDFTQAGLGIGCIKSPVGTATGPGGVSWTSKWQTELSGETGTAWGRIPADAPYGIWTGYPVACDVGAPSYVRLILPPPLSTATDHVGDHVVYGIQLVVWFGA